VARDAPSPCWQGLGRSHRTVNHMAVEIASVEIATIEIATIEIAAGAHRGPAAYSRKLVLFDDGGPWNVPLTEFR
jgi:hypothetical protein